MKPGLKLAEGNRTLQLHLSKAAFIFISADEQEFTRFQSPVDLLRADALDIHFSPLIAIHIFQPPAQETVLESLSVIASDPALTGERGNLTPSLPSPLEGEGEGGGDQAMNSEGTSRRRTMFWIRSDTFHRFRHLTGHGPQSPQRPAGRLRENKRSWASTRFRYPYRYM